MQMQTQTEYGCSCRQTAVDFNVTTLSQSCLFPQDSSVSRLQTASLTSVIHSGLCLQDNSVSRLQTASLTSVIHPGLCLQDNSVSRLQTASLTSVIHSGLCLQDNSVSRLQIGSTAPTRNVRSWSGGVMACISAGMARMRSTAVSTDMWGVLQQHLL